MKASTIFAVVASAVLSYASPAQQAAQGGYPGGPQPYGGGSLAAPIPRGPSPGGPQSCGPSCGGFQPPPPPPSGPPAVGACGASQQLSCCNDRSQSGGLLGELNLPFGGDCSSLGVLDDSECGSVNTFCCDTDNNGLTLIGNTCGPLVSL